MPNINLKYPFFNEYDTKRKLAILYHEAELETNNGTKKEDLTNLVKFAAAQVLNLEKQLDAAIDDLEDLIEYYHVCNKCARQTATGKCELWEKYGDGTCSAKW